MAVLLVLVLALVIGLNVPRWSMALVPVVAGATLILALVAAGRDVSDTPIPFVVVVATTAIVAGILLRGRMRPRTTR